VTSVEVHQEETVADPARHALQVVAAMVGAELGQKTNNMCVSGNPNPI